MAECSKTEYESRIQTIKHNAIVLDDLLKAVQIGGNRSNLVLILLSFFIKNKIGIIFSCYPIYSIIQYMNPGPFFTVLLHLKTVLCIQLGVAMNRTDHNQ